jgi:hypothetical protein
MYGLPLTVLMMADAMWGTISRRDLVAMGYSNRQIRRWVKRGLLEITARGELRIPGSSRPLQQQLATMLWRAGPGARMSGSLVLGLQDIEGFPLATAEEEIDHIAIPPGRRVRGVEFRVVRTPLPLEDHDVVLGLPALTTTRSLIAAAAKERPMRVRTAFDRARYLGLTSERLMSERLAALGNAYGAPQMRRIYASGALQHESEPERDLYGLFGPGDPKPAIQVWICHKGKWHRFDMAFLDSCIALEYDGGAHDGRREADADRDLAMLELQIITIRVTKQMMRDPEGTRHRILKVHADRLRLGLPPLVPQQPPPWA